MRRSVIVSLHSTTLKQDMAIVKESKYVLMNYGPVKAGLTTLQTTLDPQLSALLNSLTKRVKNLQSKSYTDLNTSQVATITALARHSAFITEGIGTNV